MSSSEDSKQLTRGSSGSQGGHRLFHHGAHTGIGAALAPVFAVADPRHNPFAIGALREDGTKAKGRKRKAFLKAGRSISPFRGHRRSNSATRLLVQDTPSEGAEQGSRSSHEEPTSTRTSEDAGTSDNGSDSDEAQASPVCPRNNAFSVRKRSDSKSSMTTVDSANSQTSDLEAKETGPDERSAAAQESDAGSNADGPDDETDEEEDVFDIDPVLLDNTLFNAGCLDLFESSDGGSSSQDGSRSELPSEQDADEDEYLSAPNVVLAESQAWQALRNAKGEKSRLPSGDHALVASRPVFERNRCTITLVHGRYEEAAATRARPKRYVVASDGSEEAAYAAEWTIGTVLRDGDETLIVSVMETDSKFDALDRKHDTQEAKTEHQKIRQNQALILARQATALLQRTRLGVKVSCQAIHAKNARHMLLDLIDFYEPNMVIVGSRGLGSLKGILLGSTSHYLVQKSSVPVMVVRSRLRLPRLPKGKADVVAQVKQKHLRLRDAMIEKESNATDEVDEAESLQEPEAPSSTMQDEAGSSSGGSGPKPSSGNDADEEGSRGRPRAREAST